MLKHKPYIVELLKKAKDTNEILQIIEKADAED